jgi:hypothetical protein
MTYRSIDIRFAMVVVSLLAAPSARAECIGGGEWWLREQGVELVFSGTVSEISRTAELGYRAAFDVDRVWKGNVSPRFNLYVWELAPEMDRVEVGHRYLVGAKRLIGPRERQGAGVAGSDTVAFTEIMCGAPAYEDAEASGIIRSLGVGRPPEQPPADFAFKLDCKPCMMNTLDTYRNIYTRELGLGESPVSIPVTLSTEQMAAVYDAFGSIGFFDYPSAFRGVSQTATGETTTVAPSTSYRLEVRSSGVVHSVTWGDRFFPHSEEASRLLKVFDLINGFVNDRPDVKRLPVSRAGCE